MTILCGFLGNFAGLLPKAGHLSAVAVTSYPFLMNYPSGMMTPNRNIGLKHMGLTWHVTKQTPMRARTLVPDLCLRAKKATSAMR